MVNRVKASRVRAPHSGRWIIVQGWNGLNFKQSVDNPMSRLRRVLKYLDIAGPSTKREILRDVFGYTDKEMTPSFVRGQHSIFFSLCVVKGYLKWERRGNKILWSLGPNY